MRDGSGELITKLVVSDDVVSLPIMSCGNPLITSHGGKFRRCAAGHVHCAECGGVPKKFRKGWAHVCGR